MITRSKARKPKSHRPRKSRLAQEADFHVESLEHRQLLAGLTVGNATDLVNAPDLSSISALVADDGGDGISLREAITAANNTSGADTVTFDATVFAIPQSIALGSALPTISDELTVTGPTALLTINAGNGTDGNFGTGDGFQILQIDDGNAGNQIDVNISDVRLTGADDGTSSGGAIFNAENLTLTNVQLTGNAANFGGGLTNAGTTSMMASSITGNGANVSGGGILNSGVIIVTDSEVSNNTADFGGGVANNGVATITASTIAENTAKFNGGMENAFGGTVTLTNSTISTNTATDGAAGGIGNVGSSGAGTTSLIINSSTITGNASTSNPNAAGIENLNGAAAASATINNSIVVDPVSSGGTLTGDFNLFGVSGATTGGSNDITGVNDPMLGSLQNNGGLTRTHELLVGSPALGAAAPGAVAGQNGVPQSDQRGTGFNRVMGRMDMGSFERQTEVPSLVVTTNSDVVDNSDFVTSLREAISFANSQAGADTITFDASLTGQTIHQAVALGSWEILDSLTIDGDINDDGIADITVDADSAAGLNDADNAVFRVFGSNLQTTMDGLIIRDGNSLFSNGAGFGGGIQVGSSGASDLTLLNTSVLDNSAERQGGGIILPNGNMTLINSTVSGNSAGRNGGGLAAFRGSVTLTNSTISGNSAANNGGGIYTDDVTLLTNNITITGNMAAAAGGGIWVLADDFNDAERMTLVNSIIAGNADNGTAPDFLAPGDPVNDLTVTFSLIGDNTGTTLAEAQTADANGNLIGSLAGAGIIDPLLGPLADNGGPTQTHALLVGSPALNTADPSAVAGQNGVPEFDQRGTGFDRVVGGRMDMGSFERQPEAPSLVVTTASDVVDATDSVTSLREAISFANSQAGADTITFDASLTGQTIHQAVALGSWEILDSLTIDGDINDDGTADMTIDADSATGLNDADNAVFRIFGSNLQTTMDGLIIRDGNSLFSNGAGSGGGIEVGNGAGDLTLLNTRVLDNSASEEGGGIHIPNGQLTLINSTVSGNSSEQGGGIQTPNGAVTLINSTVSGNAAGFFGGGIMAQTGNVMLTGSTVTGNTTSITGGGISAWVGSITLNNSSVTDNRSGRHAGGIDALRGNLTLIDSTVSGNQSDQNGGGIHSIEGTLSLTNSTVSGNESNGSGGGIFVRVGDLSLANSTISANSSVNGGGIFMETSGLLTAQSSIVASNTATNSGPDILAAAQSTFDIDFSLIGDNAGTTLAEAQTADANGNLIGSAAGAGIIDPLLAPLADNGGPTQTHALLVGSPAIDAGSNPDAAPFDQRGPGFDRELGAGPDMGAFELFDTTPGIRLVDGTLFVFGTENRDIVNIRLQGDQVRVRNRQNLGTPENTIETQLFTLGDVNEIGIYLRGERDRVSVANSVLIETRIDGGNGNDRIKGGGGVNILMGGNGDDQLRGGRADDILNGGAGNDRLLGLAGSDILSGNAGNDRLVGGSGSTPDVLIGGGGEDRLMAGSGDDLLIGHQMENENVVATLQTILEAWIASPTALPPSLGTLTEDGVRDLLIGGPGVDLLASDSADDERP